MNSRLHKCKLLESKESDMLQELRERGFKRRIIIFRDTTTGFIYRSGTIEHYSKHRGEYGDGQRWSRVEMTSGHCGTKMVKSRDDE